MVALKSGRKKDSIQEPGVRSQNAGNRMQKPESKIRIQKAGASREYKKQKEEDRMKRRTANSLTRSSHPFVFKSENSIMLIHAATFSAEPNTVRAERGSLGSDIEACPELVAGGEFHEVSHVLACSCFDKLSTNGKA
jgi:hypothetical protein